ncbi:hypothetical protein ABZ626_07080 [Streptomyces longispororuber]|uniref:Uncharacterized protein n=1 Tax=Streptomyces longispororuber TaxID=68230 RepID=A0A919ABM9_9ACTN|nr:hypothetical protein [Streptomyces longispororuber]GHE97392.1 hypothetical protein GCM10018785_72400 [Streptomyces longispororuber]
MSDAVHVVLDETAMVAAGRGNHLASRLIHRSSHAPGWFLYAPTCALVEAERERPGTAEHIAALPGVIIHDLDLAAALDVGGEDTWAAAHCRYAARPTPSYPDGAFIATVTPDRWADHRHIDLNP